MSTSVSELDSRLAATLHEESRRREQSLEELLGRIERLAEWRAAPLPDDLRALLEEQRAERAQEVVELLLSWRRLGGTLALRGAGAPEPAEAPREVVEPRELREPFELREPREARVVSIAPAGAPLEDEPPTDRIPNGKPAIAAHAASTPLNLASAEAIASLKAHVEGGGGFRVQAPPADWPARLAEQLRELLPARDPDADLGAVIRVVDAVEKWRVLPPEVQATLVGLLAARLRALQEYPGFLGDRRIDFAFGSLSAYVKRARPGFVYGLARWHTPTRETWEADAEAMYERLAAMIPTPAEAEPNQHRQLDAVEQLVKELDICPPEARSAVAVSLRREVLAAFAMGVQARNPRLVRVLAAKGELFDGPEFRTLRRAIREEADEARAEAAEEEGGPEEHLPPEWAWWTFTRGRRALIIGGDPREPSRQRLEKAFGFAELEWVGAEFKRNNLLGVRERVRAGRTDLVILLTRFTGHDADQIIIPACRETNVPFVCVQHGYGVVRVRHAIERFLDPESRR